MIHANCQLQCGLRPTSPVNCMNLPPVSSLEKPRSDSGRSDLCSWPEAEEPPNVESMWLTFDAEKWHKTVNLHMVKVY